MTTAAEMLALYQEAEKKVLQGQEVLMNGRKLTRANLTEIQSGIKIYQRKANAEQQTARGQSRFAYADFSKSTL